MSQVEPGGGVNFDLPGAGAGSNSTYQNAINRLNNMLGGAMNGALNTTEQVNRNNAIQSILDAILQDLTGADNVVQQHIAGKGPAPTGTNIAKILDGLAKLVAGLDAAKKSLENSPDAKNPNSAAYKAIQQINTMMQNLKKNIKFTDQSGGGQDPQDVATLNKLVAQALQGKTLSAAQQAEVAKAVKGLTMAGSLNNFGKNLETIRNTVASAIQTAVGLAATLRAQLSLYSNIMKIIIQAMAKLVDKQGRAVMKITDRTGQ